MKDKRKLNRLLMLFSLSVVIVGVCAYIITIHETNAQEFRLNTFNRNPSGLSVLFEAIAADGLPVTRSMTKPSDVPYPDSANFILIDPGVDFYYTEKEELAGQIRSGAQVLLMYQNTWDVDFPLLGLRMESAEQYYSWDMPEEIKYKAQAIPPSPVPAYPDPMFRDFDSLKLENINNYLRDEDWYEPVEYKNWAYLYTDSLPLVPLLTTRGEVVAGYVQLGKGRIYLFSMPEIVSNQGMNHEGNARFILGLIRSMHAHRPAPWYFDEYFHGYGSHQEFNILARPEVRRAVWAFLLIYALAIWSLSRTTGHAVPILRRERRSIDEYITSLANLYRTRNAEAGLFADFFKRFDRSLVRFLGLPGDPEKRNNEMIVEKAMEAWGKEAAEEVRSMYQSAFTIGKSYHSASAARLSVQIRKFMIRHKLDHYGSRND